MTDPGSQHGFFLALEWPCRWIVQMALGMDHGHQRTLQMWAHPSCTDMDAQQRKTIRGGAGLAVGLRQPNTARWLTYRPA